MAGIYIHIPFCRHKCNYCDFYSIKDSGGVEELVKAEITELSLRKDYVQNEIVKTIYFGGGTPSLLSLDMVGLLLENVRSNFDVSDDCEITFEANPDDLTESYLSGLRGVGVNRLSIGFQSFNDEILKYLGRRHDSKRLAEIIDFANIAGFNNISADLIFGIPGMAFDVYMDSLTKMISLNIQHVSAYSLTIEKGTMFYKMLKNKTLYEIPEEQLLNQYNTTVDFLLLHGFYQYEISNYAKKDFQSRHNSSYWENENYLGIGPSAHSYNGTSRQWNMSNTKKYSDHIRQEKSTYEIEFLTANDKFNEYIITHLRTSNGISRDYISRNFNEVVGHYLYNEIEKLVNSDLLIVNDNNIILTRKGMLVSDYILRQLYFV